MTDVSGVPVSYLLRVNTDGDAWGSVQIRGAPNLANSDSLQALPIVAHLDFDGGGFPVPRATTFNAYKFVTKAREKRIKPLSVSIRI